MDDVMEFLFALGVVVLIVIVGVLLHALLVWGAWSWAIVPLWGAAAITYKQSIALSVFVNILIPSLMVKVNGKKD